MKRNLFLLRLALLLGSLLLFALQQLQAQQMERLSADTLRTISSNREQLPTDSLHALPASTLPTNVETTAAPLVRKPLQADSILFRLPPTMYPVIPYYINPSPMFRGDYYTEGLLLSTSYGILSASGRQTSLPGIGRLNEAGVGYQWAFAPRWMLQLNADVMKVNMMHAVGEAFSLSGSLSYRLSDRLSLNAFGAYAPGNTFGMFTHRYGGSLSYDVTNRFGMEVGVQRYYNMMQGWQTVPVVMPTYNFGKCKVGLDVGGLVLDVLQHIVYDK